MIHLKYYILIALIPSLISYCWIARSNRFPLFKYVISFVIMTSIAFNIHYIFPNYNIVELLINKQKDFVGLAEFQQSGSKIELSSIEPSVTGLISNMPQALRNTFIWSNDFTINSPFVLMAIIENFVVLGLIGLCLIYRKAWNRIEINLFLFCILFVITLYSLIGLVTPVMGAVMRYKIPGLPFLLIAMLLILDKAKLINKFPFFRHFI